MAFIQNPLNAYDRYLFEQQSIERPIPNVHFEPWSIDYLVSVKVHFSKGNTNMLSFQGDW